MLQEKNRVDSLESYTSTISHEFRTPIGTSLMFLEGTLDAGSGLSAEGRTRIELVVCQLNLLLCLVNDILDIKLIETGMYTPKLEIFAPQSVFSFITQIF